MIASTVGSYMVSAENVTPTLQARDYKDPQIVVGFARRSVREQEE